MERFTNDKGQVIGWWKEGVFRKRVIGSKHQLRKPPAWGIDEKVFKNIYERTSEIRIKDTETNKIYAAPASTWMEKGFTQDRGHGLQRFLTLEEFEDDTVDFNKDVKDFDKQ